MNIIVAVTADWGIGKAGKMLCSLPEDMKFFRETTHGAVLLMGRKTLESFPGGRPLKGRVNLVLTRDTGYDCEGAVLLHSEEEARCALSGYDTDTVFVIGGAEIYAAWLPYCKTAYVTKMQLLLPLDCRMVDLDTAAGWRCVDPGIEQVSGGVFYRFTRYENSNVKPL